MGLNAQIFLFLISEDLNLHSDRVSIKSLVKDIDLIQKFLKSESGLDKGDGPGPA